MATAPLPRAEARGASESSDTTALGEQKKRGWTMFMDAPIADLAQKAPPAPEEPEPPQVGASDKKGWTVFGEPSPVAVPEPTPVQPGVASVAVTGSEAPERGKTVMYTGNAAPVPRPYGGESGEAPRQPTAAELARAAAAEHSAEPQRSVVAHGMAAQTGPDGGVTGRTAAAGAGNLPDTMYFKRGQVEPERPVSPRAPTARDLEPPASLRPIEERAPRSIDPSSPSVMSPSPSPPVTTGGGSKVIYIVVGVIVLGGIATAAFFAFT
jgi:hypothetical protein